MCIKIQLLTHRLMRIGLLTNTPEIGVLIPHDIQHAKPQSINLYMNILNLCYQVSCLNKIRKLKKIPVAARGNISKKKNKIKK